MPPHSARTELLDCKRIRQLRHAHGYSVRRIARQLGVSATTITNLETGVNHAEVALRLVTDLSYLREEALGEGVVEAVANRYPSKGDATTRTRWPKAKLTNRQRWNPCQNSPTSGRRTGTGASASETSSERK